MTKQEGIAQRYWKSKFHWGRKLEGCRWFRGWCIRYRADNTIKLVTWKIRMFGRVITI